MNKLSLIAIIVVSVLYVSLVGILLLLLQVRLPHFLIVPAVRLAGITVVASVATSLWFSRRTTKIRPALRGEMSVKTL